MSGAENFAEAEERLPGVRRRKLPLGFWERWCASGLEKGGHWPEAMRRHGGDDFRYQVWLYDHRVEE